MTRPVEIAAQPAGDGAVGALAPLHLIVAYARNRVIGADLDLPWHYPEDLRHFKTTTLGHAVIMGRKSWDAVKRRPLPGRPNLVVTRQPGFQAPGAAVCSDLPSAIARARTLGEQPPFIIGGGEIYRAAMPLVTRLYLTEIQREIAGDTTFPEIDPRAWRTSSERWSDDRMLRFLVLDRIAAET